MLMEMTLVVGTAYSTELLNHYAVHLKLMEHCVSPMLKKIKKVTQAGRKEIHELLVYRDLLGEGEGY